MTKTFCDVCSKEMIGHEKFKVTMSSLNTEELDVCSSCKENFIKARKQADIDTFVKLRRK